MKLKLCSIDLFYAPNKNIVYNNQSLAYNSDLIIITIYSV